MMARWHEAVPEGSDPDLATSLDVARRASARYVLVGSMVGDESGLQLTAKVYAPATGAQLGEARVVGLPDSMFALVDQLSVESLRVMLGSAESELPRIWSLRGTTTSSLQALKEYLEGEAHYRNARFVDASLAFERAVSADSTFALALYRLASTYGWLENIGSAAPSELFERAMRFADRLPPREALFVRANYALHVGTLEGIGPPPQSGSKISGRPGRMVASGRHVSAPGSAGARRGSTGRFNAAAGHQSGPRFQPVLHPPRGARDSPGTPGSGGGSDGAVWSAGFGKPDRSAQSPRLLPRLRGLDRPCANDLDRHRPFGDRRERSGVLSLGCASCESERDRSPARAVPVRRRPCKRQPAVLLSPESRTPPGRL
jgi:hypothetical protein